MAQSGKSVVVIEVGGRWLKMARVDFSRGGVKMSRLHTARHDGDLAVVPEMISQAFGVEMDKATSIAADVAGYRLLPLSGFLPGLEELIVKWGGTISCETLLAPSLPHRRWPLMSHHPGHR